MKLILPGALQPLARRSTWCKPYENPVSILHTATGDCWSTSVKRKLTTYGSNTKSGAPRKGCKQPYHFNRTEAVQRWPASAKRARKNEACSELLRTKLRQGLRTAKKKLLHRQQVTLEKSINCSQSLFCSATDNGETIMIPGILFLNVNPIKVLTGGYWGGRCASMTGGIAVNRTQALADRTVCPCKQVPSFPKEKL